MEQLNFKLDPHNEEQKELSELLLTRQYSKEALQYIPNLARTLNIYKVYKTNHSVLPERPKKTKFTFVELVWIKMVFDLRRFGLDFDVIKELKDFLFSKIEKESILKEIEKKRQKIDVMLQNISSDKKEIFYKELNKTLSSDLSYQQLNISFLLIIIINCVIKKMPIDFRVYLNGRIDLYSDFPDEDLIKKEKDQELLNKSFISISLTKIISFYLDKPAINPSLKENMFLKDELLILETIKNERPDSITIEFNQNHTIKLIKLKKGAENQYQPAPFRDSFK
ncbi:MAG: hypothetical protein IPI88_18835 [Chitinophagaceae bacterium]|nr:hypothetical protein [Chitinophagaceae bacterium]